MTSAGYLVVVLVLLVTCSVAELANEFVEASEGSTANLPCSLSAAEFPDKVSNILWYRGAEESPIYKYEARGSHPRHWAEGNLQNRYFLRVSDKQAQMTISPTKNSDEGDFHCRVDFQHSATKITHVNLTVIGK
ncbi:hypothetical protein GWI33_007674 [Rhynchophorus ferrugineus]|uniref:Ig-like domain-containing protein n=1 Tax=Rhynchophorus ferrugineus TaxID=354439 RepID=A0A834IFS1_RHYFE|nr:hypothetical protein GWI33_007674 [Rhynchophorus ferrugineus]